MVSLAVPASRATNRPPPRPRSRSSPPIRKRGDTTTRLTARLATNKIPTREPDQEEESNRENRTNRKEQPPRPLRRVTMMLDCATPAPPAFPRIPRSLPRLLRLPNPLAPARAEGIESTFPAYGPQADPVFHPHRSPPTPPPPPLRRTNRHRHRHRHRRHPSTKVVRALWQALRPHPNRMAQSKQQQQQKKGTVGVCRVW